MREIRNLVAHDSLCPALLQACQCELCDPYCACDILAQARFDEREKAAQRVLAYYAESGDEIATSLHYGLGDAARGEDTK